MHSLLITTKCHHYLMLNGYQNKNIEELVFVIKLEIVAVDRLKIGFEDSLNENWIKFNNY